MIILALAGILGIVMVQVVIFSLLTMAKQAEEEHWRLNGILEDGRNEGRQTMVEKGQTTQPAEELTKNSLEMRRRASA